MKESKEGSDWFTLFKQGNKDAFKRVFELHYRSVLFFASALLKQDSFAEDIVSQTFFKAWDKHSHFESPRHLENFLFLVTRNSCISYLNAGRLSKSAISELLRLSREAEEPEKSIDLEWLQTQLIEQLHHHLGSLPDGHILRMLYLERKSVQEVAGKLNITESALYVKKHRALKSLRKRMDKEGLHFLIWLLVFYH